MSDTLQSYPSGIVCQRGVHHLHRSRHIGCSSCRHGIAPSIWFAVNAGEIRQRVRDVGFLHAIGRLQACCYGILSVFLQVLWSNIELGVGACHTGVLRTRIYRSSEHYERSRSHIHAILAATIMSVSIMFAPIAAAVASVLSWHGKSVQQSSTTMTCIPMS